VRTDIINITLSYKHTPRIEIAYINCFVNSLNIYIKKTLVLSFGTLFIYSSINKKLYYNNGLSLNKSINLISISL